MIIRGSVLLPILLSTASAYFAQVNNAHVEFAASGVGSGVVETAEVSEPVETVETLETEDMPDVVVAGMTPQILELFENWITEFEKEYESLEEKTKRAMIWLENHVMIETHNSQEPKSSFTLGHNEFSDMTHKEFRQRFFLGEFTPELDVLRKKEFKFAPYSEDEEEKSSLRGGSSDEAYSATERRLGSTDMKESQDWASMGLIGPIRNQGICGACWAFSAIGAIESAMAIEKYRSLQSEGKFDVESDADEGLVIPLSEQNLIDCDTLYEKGCMGGLMTTTFEEEEVKKGICTESDYPYHQSQGTCSADMCTPVEGSVVKDHVDILPRKTNALAEAVLKQPVTAAMVATDPMFQFYKSGIFQKEDCGRVNHELGEQDCKMLYQNQDTCLPDINHGVLVVGYGKDESVNSDVKTFFKVKNSWGNKWGEDGFFRLARYEEDPQDPKGNWGMCGILTLLSYPVME